jgi:hypothetical protein
MADRHGNPFVERLIGTIRREFLDRTLFWNATDLERKLETLRQYYNTHRVHSSLDGDTPSEITSETVIRRAALNISSGNLIAAIYFSCRLPPE